MRTNSIVIFSRYPTAEQERDGYYQRVLEIDQLLNSINRYYVEFTHAPTGFPKPTRIRDQVYRILIDPRKISHWLYLSSISLIARKVYSHSILNLSNALARFIFWVPGIQKVLDLHGVVPEEFRLYGDYLSGQYHDEYEEHAVHHASLVIVVSNSMGAHLRRKYPQFKNLNTLTLPVFSTFEKARGADDAPYSRSRPVAIYAGGTQKWQQIDLMVDAIIQTCSKVDYQIFVPEPEVVGKLFEAAPAETQTSLARIPVISVDKSALPDYYRQANFGFVLRENITVNQVACPTKIIEYLQFGIIPIVNSKKIGDFDDLGMEALFLKDLLSGNFPEAEEFQRMRKKNHEIVGQLVALSKSGSEKLKEFLL